MRLHHWMYGVTPGEGYGIKAWSTGLNIALFEGALRGRYTPIRGDAVQSAGGVDSRMIHPASSGDDFLLSKIGRGPPDELGRPTFQNHITVVPKPLLAAGKVSFASVEAAVAAFEESQGVATKELPPLEVAPLAAGYRPGAGLRQHLSKASIETLATRALTEVDGRTLLLVRDTLPPIRNEILYRLVELLNLVGGMAPFTAMSDAPTASAMNDFNLVVAPRGIRGDNSWAIVESAIDKPALARVRKGEAVYQAIEQSFAADAQAFG